MYTKVLNQLVKKHQRWLEDPAMGERLKLDDEILADKDLSGKDLRRAVLNYVNFEDANLSGVNFEDADLDYSNMINANLAGANLRGASLHDVYLSEACLLGATLPEGIPVIPDIHKAVYAAASQIDALDMSNWHTCNTTHCRAGWVVTLSGEAGKELERRLNNTGTAAALIYQASDPTLERIPSWHVSNDQALDDMKRLAEQ